MSAPATTLHPWLRIPAPRVFELCFPERGDDRELVAFYEYLYEEVRKTDTDYAVIVGLTRAAATSPVQRRVIAEYERKMAPHAQRHCRGAALFGGNALMRGVVTAIYWLQPPVYPYTIVASRIEALEWAERQLSAGA